jgi:hypothetical protein
MPVHIGQLRLLKPSDIATKIDTKPSTLAKWRLDGVGPPYIKVGGRVMYDEDTVEHWMRSRMVKSTSEALDNKVTMKRGRKAVVEVEG